jgi:hypothetical protein
MKSVVVVIGICAYAGVASAQRRAETPRQAIEAAGTHVDVMGGVGIESFIDRNMRSAVGAGVSWAVRGALGNPLSVSVELAYLGSRQPVRLMDAGSDVIGHGVYGGFRINVYPELRWEPFFFVGAGWSRYSVSQRPASSLLAARDDVAVFPIGFGGAYRRGSFVVDLRAGVRIVSAPDLMENPDPMGSENSHSMHRFGVTTNVGYSF